VVLTRPPNPAAGPLLSIAAPLTVLKAELLHNRAPQVPDVLPRALQEGTAVHLVESQLWDLTLPLGRRSSAASLDACGTGDLGATLPLPDGHDVQRLGHPHTRRYVSIFGECRLPRTASGSREGPAWEFVPSDNRWQLPRSVFSCVLQDRDQALAVGQAFSRVNRTSARMLTRKQAVDSLGGMNQQLAQDVGWLRDPQGTPPPAEGGQIVVTTADCKGVVRRGQATPAVCGGQRPAGGRAHGKRMATVAAVCTAGPCVRTAAEVAAALCRDPDCPAAPRPEPRPKRVWASLPHEGPKPRSSMAAVSDWWWWEFAQRNPPWARPTACLGEGQEALWRACAEAVGAPNRVAILDVLHVTPRWWQAGELL
jgi:hypothetical protein